MGRPVPLTVTDTRLDQELMMNRLLPATLAIVILGLTTAAARAELQVINVDIGSGNSPVYVGQGAAGTGGDFWNPIKAQLPAPLLDSGSNATPVSVLSIQPGFHWWQKEPTWLRTVAGAGDLMGDYWALGRRQVFTIELGGIPLDWTFDLFVYAAGDTNNQGTLVTILDEMQATTGIEGPEEPLTKGKHYLVFTNLSARAGSLLIKAQHNPEQPGEFGAVNGFQMIVHEPPEPTPVAAPVTLPDAPLEPPSASQSEVTSETPPATPSEARDRALSSGLWVVIGFGMAVILVLVLRLIMKPAPAPAVAAETRPALPEGSHPRQRETPVDAFPQDSAVSGEGEAWRERAQAAERRAAAAETVVRDGLMPEMEKFLKQEVVSTLVSERDVLLEAQRQAVMDIAAFERRLVEMQAPVRDRLDAYEQRISELEKELNKRGAENRELLTATIALARRKVQEERARRGVSSNN